MADSNNGPSNNLPPPLYTENGASSGLVRSNSYMGPSSASFNDSPDNDTNGGNLSVLAARRKRNRSNIASFDAVSLPHGWERISDAHYGVYYIDHINKRTQYERPYEIELTKGANGFGFTLIELDKGLVVVKSIVPRGPAHVNGIIQPGDVLVSVSGLSVSGLQHSDIARLFATFAVGDRVKLTFARGYQLPFDFQADDDREYEFISITLTRGSDGFGFTISDSIKGQSVKKILDVERCGLLRQGDVLVNVNNIDLSFLPHSKVVEALKQCPIGEAANITVKRKKRFRSKTPLVLQSSSPTGYMEENTSVPERECKTPNREVMEAPQDLEWINEDEFGKGAHNNNPVQQRCDSHDFPTHSNPSNPMVNYDYSNYANTYINHDCDNENTMYSNLSAMQQAIQENNLMINSKNDASDNQIYQMQPQDMSSLAPMFSSMRLDYSNNVPQNGYVNENVIHPNENERFVDEDEYEYFMVTLTRGESGFGFRIVGGAEEGRNIAVGSIVIGGVAHKDGILKAGDEILSINGQEVIGTSHHQVVALMSQCNRTVSLLIRRKKNFDAFDVVLQREANEDFGFVIISCVNGALIGRIIEGSPAYRCGRLRIRDKIIMVNLQDITSISHSQVVNMIKDSGRTLHLRIIPADCYSVELIRGMKGFGFSIRGGAEFNGVPLFVLRIAPDGPAYSLLNTGDEIIEINGVSTFNMTHAEAVQMVHLSGPQVRLKLRRGNSSNIHNIISPPAYDANHLPPSVIYSYPPYPSSHSAPSLMQSQHLMHHLTSP